jgi:glycosyltransferase involved in cell wall biosynthesis
MAQAGASEAGETTGSGSEAEPVFGFILFGGPLSGALIRDIRLVNELARRGYQVHVWWVMDRTRSVELEPAITEHWLANALYFARIPGLGRWMASVKDAIGRGFGRVFPDRRRDHFLQTRPWFLDAMIQGLLRAVAGGIERDRWLIGRFARELEAAGVTHVLPMLAVLCPFIEAARERVGRRIEYLVTFQGYELYLNYARQIGCEARLHEVFRQTVANSGRNAIAVSEDYRERVVEDIGLSRDQITPIPPGVPTPAPMDRGAARARIEQIAKERHRQLEPGVPLVTYLGRQDSEKGIDLLLYAAAMLQREGMPIQLAITGPTLFDGRYALACRQIARNLRLEVLRWRGVSDPVRLDLLAGSDCVVYPSIHREPFGMVPVEAVSQGTPAIVPDYGGVAHVIEGYTTQSLPASRSSRRGIRRGCGFGHGIRARWRRRSGD